jgi:CSLREA domain-containing protein
VRPAVASPDAYQGDAPTATFIVNSTDDFPDLVLNGVCATAFGTCTLRAAIQEVNNTGGASGPHNIHFNIAGAGPHTIQIFSPLPRLERAVVIDGTSEFGATCPTATLTANIMIVIDGTPLGSNVLRGLDLWRNAAAPSGSTIKGVAIGGFGYGVWLDGDGHAVRCSIVGLNADGASALGNQTAGIYVWQGSGITIGGSAYADRNVISENTRDGGISLRDGDAASILGNYIGTSSAGTLDRGNANGILVGELSNNVVIGGTGAAERNVISGNSKGITINGDNASVVNNLIGPNALGTAALGNGWGIEINEPAAGTAIGGGQPSQGNVISGNGVDGIYIDDADGAVILNNKIGVALNGVDALGNGANGVFLDNDVNSSVVGQPTDGNTIAFNGGDGVRHYYCCGYQGFSTNGNSFRGNSIHSNGELGIDLTGSNWAGGVTLNDGPGDADTGPNDYQNYPGLLLARNSGYMYGLLVTRGNIQYTVDFYETDTCDDSGYGEGKTWLGSINVTTDAAGSALIDTTLANAPALGRYVTTTATASDGSTSEFSLCTLVTQQTFIVNATGDTGDQTPGDGLCDVIGASTNCTLRAAIQEVNALGGGPFAIAINLGAGGGTIRPASALPSITVPVVIDAVSQQSGAFCGSEGTPASLNAVLKGDLTTGVDGLTLASGSGGSTIKGLVINEFDGHGIRVSSNNNEIVCNFIGTGQAGTAAQPNGLDGVHVTGNNNRIGGDSAALRNVLSGNLGSGVEINGASATGNKVKGNIIGLASGGGAALGNGASGVEIDAAVNSVVGGNSPVEGNIISANGQQGVRIHNAAAGNAVRGNTIGLNEAGTADRGNSNAGVLLDNAADNVVGGVNNDYGNMVAGNTGHGVLVQGGASSNNIRHNRIGLDANGAALPNDGAGVRFNQSSDNWVGDNTIANNAQGGVIVMPSGQMNRIRSNSIYGNTGLGIDLNNDGVTLNDGAGDPDTGGNGLQNFPVISAIDFVAGTVDATLNSTANMPFTIDFFSSPQCDASSYGEGQTFLGTYTGTSNGGGALSFTHPLAGLVDGEYLTAVATDANDNSSEFSPCAEIVGCPDPDVDNDNDVDVADITLVANRWNNPGLYDPAYDVTCDGVIDMRDIIIVTRAFGT